MRKQFNVGIPCYLRPEKLLLLLDDINTSTAIPNKVVVVDNSRKLVLDERKYRFPVQIVRPHYNVGCPTAWNTILRNSLPQDTIIFNEDIRLSTTTVLEEMVARPEDMVFCLGFSSFMFRASVYDRAGMFDENIWPVYYEDTEFGVRLKCTVKPYPTNFGNKDWVQHTGGTAKVPEGRYVNDKPLITRNRTYVQEKWGMPVIDRPTFTAAWNGEPAPDIMDWEFEYRRKIPSDVHEHMPLLRELASQCTRVTEFGTRHGTSAVAFLAGRPDFFTTYDWIYHAEADCLYHLAGRTVVKRVQDNTIKMSPIDRTDLLFLDTAHNYTHLREELRIHGSQVNKFLVFHDTMMHRDEGDDHNRPALWQAIEEFRLMNPEWKKTHELENNCGLTVLTKS